MSKYRFDGPDRFARKVANETGDAEKAGDLAGDPHVRDVAEMVARLDGQADDPKAKDATRREIEAELDHHDRAGAVARAMVNEAFPTHGFAQPAPVIGRQRMSAPGPARPPDPRRAGAVFEDQPLGPDGKPLTLDPNNPDHAEHIRRVRAAAEDLPPSEVLAVRQSDGWAQTAAVRADAALRGYSDRDLIVGSPNPEPRTAAPETIDPREIDREFDRYMATQGPEAAAERARMARVRATGADVGMTGGPPRPNTGVNQDINQRDVPTQFDEPTQVHDPFQRLNPPYIDPNETDHGQSIKRPQSATQGTGLTETAMRAQAGLPHDQVGTGAVDPADPLTGKVPPESEHPEFGGGTGKVPPPTAERKAGKK